MIWVNSYGDGRVVNNLLGHDAAALEDPQMIAWLKKSIVWAGRARTSRISKANRRRTARR